ncbi:flagellar basal body L-ring protein FlgH [Desulfobaculum bizertense]|uniref:Flagellar L-ring protein n=2 Tax=Desulfobaculum TaxID=1433996 RepID=A0A1T4W874_9BACT|nr:flagellar basal body L-ring protein FlgH [Desulfobaculum bizertense]UIJ39049.1 flagellar basal body L-ring protein FlgH [Desulfobaculum bizertense]SKA72891.1 flagellar L-ring protein precursor FlgH [Desulfobaculum bizertense DSM 18034]
MKKICIFTLAAALCAGCTPHQQVSKPMPVLTPPVEQAPPPQDNPGSLYSPGEADYLFSDNRARRVGDIVLVNIVETSSAMHKAETTADRDATVNMGVGNFFGRSKVELPLVGSIGNTGTTPILSAGVNNTFDGEGETKRSSNVTATIAARVIRAMPGGMLQIEGAREVKVNDENQVLVVRGLVRARDVARDNSITSNQIADAHIEYYGRGVLGDKQRPGWLTRLLDQVWPF